MEITDNVAKLPSLYFELWGIFSTEIKGNSTIFKISGKKPFAMTLDEVFNMMNNKNSDVNTNIDKNMVT